MFCELNIVGKKPFILKLGLIDFLTSLTVFKSCARPSSAKNSHWIGIITEFDAERALIVIGPSAGGESIMI